MPLTHGVHDIQETVGSWCRGIVLRWLGGCCLFLRRAGGASCFGFLAKPEVASKSESAVSPAFRSVSSDNVVTRRRGGLGVLVVVEGRSFEVNKICVDEVGTATARATSELAWPAPIPPAPCTCPPAAFSSKLHLQAWEMEGWEETYLEYKRHPRESSINCFEVFQSNTTSCRAYSMITVSSQLKFPLQWSISRTIVLL